jgi:PAS domain S-box-containing protein
MAAGNVKEYEQRRLNALKLYDILDTLPEKEYDDITRLAAEICQTPIALISLVDANRQWIKSRFGLELEETDREVSFCAHAIKDEHIFEVADATADTSFANNPLVTGAPYIRYYAGAPLITSEGYRLGTLCVINSTPHKLGENQKRSLQILAQSVMSLLDLRYKQKEADFFKNALNEIAAVSVFDENFQCEFVNKKFCELAEVTTEEAIGKSATEVSSSDITTEEENKITSMIRQGIIYRNNIKNQSRKGNVTWNNITIIPFTNKNNDLVKIFSLRINITTQMQILERLEAAEKLSKTGNWEFNALNGKRYWSKGMYAIMEVEESDDPAQHPTLPDFLVPEDKERMDQVVQSLLKGEESGEDILEARVITRSGKQKHLSIATKKLCNSRGELLMLTGTVQDITAKKEAEEAVKKAHEELESKEAKYRSLVEETSQLAFTTDAEGRYTYVSPRLKKLVGFEDEHIMGKQFAFINDEGWRKKTIQFYVQQLQDRTNETSYVFPIRNAQGEQIWLQQIATLVVKNNEISGFRCVLHDITERVTTENAMREAVKLATEAKDMQQNFLSKMSHEIRTPMNGVVGLVNLLKNTPLTDKQKVYVDGIRESAVNLVRIINDILDISKIEAGKVIFEDAEFDLAKLVNNVVLTIKSAADEKRLLIATHIDQNVPVSLIADPVRLNQVLLNLASNAIKFTEKGNVIINVGTVAVSDDTAILEFKVADTGIGIAADKLDTIFESFTQAESSTTRKYGGTGLGLTIAKQLIEQQKGTVSVESELGRGTTFSFTYNCKIVKEKARIAGKASAEESRLPSMENYSILLVEDNIINQMVAKHTLENWGAKVTIADRGFKAIDMLKAGSFDLILMDIQMPEMSGIDTTRIIREELGLKIPIIAMTASAMKGERDGCIAVGMNDYFPKPFEYDDFNKIVHKHLSKSKKHDEPVLFDLNGLLSIVDNDVHFAKEILTIFLAKTPNLLKQINQNSLDRNLEQLDSDIHNLRGTVSIFAKPELSELLIDIETDIKLAVLNEATLYNINTLKQKLHQLLEEATHELTMM